MQDKLRRRYQVRKELSRGGSYRGKIAASELARLCSMIDSGEAIIAVEFEITPSGYEYPMLKGRIDTCLAVECQRCIKPIELPMEFEFNLLVDAPDEVIEESGLDTVYSDEGYLDLFEVVEDELILNLPLIALHEDNTCNIYWRNPEEKADVAVKENPFSVLKELKTIN